MASFVTALPALAFPQQLDALRIDCEGAASVRVAVDAGAERLFEATLYADASGEAALLDLAMLLEDWLAEGRATDVGFALDGTLAATVAVVSSRNASCGEAADFCNGSFLSLLDGEKPTWEGATEYCAAWFEGDDAALVAAAPSLHSLWGNPLTGQVLAQDEVFASATSADNKVWTLEMRPASFPPPAAGFSLLSFTARLGGRKQTYVLQPATDAAPLSLRFTNNFGVPETFHFFGTAEKELKPTRSTASFYGKTRNYKVEAVPTWKCHTGALPESVQPLFADLCAARRVWREDTAREVTITDSELKLSNDRYEVQAGTVTFRETDRTAMHGKRNVPQKVFDDTFDNTFE